MAEAKQSRVAAGRQVRALQLSSQPADHRARRTPPSSHERCSLAPQRATSAGLRVAAAVARPTRLGPVNKSRLPAPLGQLIPTGRPLFWSPPPPLQNGPTCNWRGASYSSSSSAQLRPLGRPYLAINLSSAERRRHKKVTLTCSGALFPPTLRFSQPEVGKDWPPPKARWRRPATSSVN